MDICLIRHAEAVQPSPGENMSDFDRPLTERGWAQARQLASGLPNRGIRVERLFVSPLVRAQQTAEPLISTWGLTGDAVVDCPELAPGAGNRKLARRIGEQPDLVVGLVGHRPDLNDFAGWLIGSKKVSIALDKGGVALIHIDGAEVDKGTGELIWLLPDGWL